MGQRLTETRRRWVHAIARLAEDSGAAPDGITAAHGYWCCCSPLDMNLAAGQTGGKLATWWWWRPAGVDAVASNAGWGALSHRHGEREREPCCQSSPSSTRSPRRRPPGGWNRKWLEKGPRTAGWWLRETGLWLAAARQPLPNPAVFGQQRLRLIDHFDLKTTCLDVEICNQPKTIYIMFCGALSHV
jgi:hypothetical protein